MRMTIPVSVLIAAAFFSAMVLAPPEIVLEPSAASARAQTQIADLEDQLSSGLLCRRPEEFAFVSHVVDLVEERVLPLQLVKETFQWARKKRPFPFVYFERALRLRAAAIGVTI